LDGNGNGLLERQELTRFWWDSMEYVQSYGCPLMDCVLESFSYNLRSGQLDFSSSWSYRDDWAYSSSSAVAGDRIHFFGYTGEGGGSSYDTLWTDQTIFAITPAPVPEAPMALMLAAGLASLALFSRRIKQKSQPRTVGLLVSA